MLDVEVDRIRVDELKEFVEEQKQEAEEDRILALQQHLGNTVSEKSGEIQAYEDVLTHLNAISGNQSKSLSKLRK